METVNLPKNVTPSTLKLGNLKVLENNSKAVYLRFNDGPLIIQTPNLHAPFGTSKFNSKDAPEVKPGDKDKWSLQLSLKNIEDNKSVAEFYKMLKGIENMVLEAGVENSKAWWKREKSLEILKEHFTPMVAYPKDKVTGEIIDKYPPTFRIGVIMSDGKIACDCYDPKGEKLDLSTIEKGSRVTAIIQCNGIWIVNNNFGVSWKPLQLKVTTNTAIKGFAFKDDDDDSAAPVSATSKYIESSDDEEEAEDPLDKSIPPPEDSDNDEVVPEPEPEVAAVVDEEAPSKVVVEEKKPEKKGRGKK